MKRIMYLFLILAFAVSAAGCTKAAQEENNQQNFQFTQEEMPRIDGSTATIPLSEGLAKTLLGMTEEEAGNYIHHNKTDEAYYNLMRGQCDIIFVTPPSEEELAMQEEYGLEWEMIPVVNDAFVFLVHEENPVQSLEVSQLQDIYRGKIVNWKELGGNDQPILAFQRPDNSGSQTLFYRFLLSKEEAQNPPTELVEMTMAGLIERVSAYDSGVNSIGYSVYYYANEMYANDHSRLLGVNGVVPNDDTIASGQYPFISPYYAIIRSGSPQNSPERRLLQFLLSEEGQRMAADCGYVPLQPLEK